MNEGTILKFNGQGNELPGLKNSDLIVTIKLLKHDHFKRVNDNDLLYIADISLKDSLSSTPIQIHTLDNRFLSIFIDEIQAISNSKTPPARISECLIYNRSRGLPLRVTFLT